MGGMKFYLYHAIFHVTIFVTLIGLALSIPNTEQQINNESELVIELPEFRLYKNRRIVRLLGEEIIPPSPDAKSGVRSKDVIISPFISARLFMPVLPDPTRKLPLIVFLHGGKFCFHTPFNARYNRYGGLVAAAANAVVLSVHYRRAPESLLPIAYEDTWNALCWVASHLKMNGSEIWLNSYVNFKRIFLMGVSSGAVQAHYATRQTGVEGVPGGLKISGLVLAHPSFSNGPLNKFQKLIYPTNSGSDDPRLSPYRDPELGRLGSGKVLVFVAENDSVRDRGVEYYKALKRSCWVGKVELFESLGEGHGFHLSDPSKPTALAVMNKIVSFINMK